MTSLPKSTLSMQTKHNCSSSHAIDKTKLNTLINVVFHTKLTIYPPNSQSVTPEKLY